MLVFRAIDSRRAPIAHCTKSVAHIAFVGGRFAGLAEFTTALHTRNSDFMYDNQMGFSLRDIQRDYFYKVLIVKVLGFSK